MLGVLGMLSMITCWGRSQKETAGLIMCPNETAGLIVPSCAILPIQKPREHPTHPST